QQFPLGMNLLPQYPLFPLRPDAKNRQRGHNTHQHFTNRRRLAALSPEFFRNRPDGTCVHKRWQGEPPNALRWLGDNDRRRPCIKYSLPPASPAFSAFLSPFPTSSLPASHISLFTFLQRGLELRLGHAIQMPRARNDAHRPVGPNPRQRLDIQS